MLFLCHSAGLSPELEKPGLLQARPYQGATPEDGVCRNTDARRPADVYLPRWRQGLPVALDFAVTSALRPNAITATSYDATASVTSYENFKRQHNHTAADCEAEGLSFIPMIVEADGGAWGPAAEMFLSELAKVSIYPSLFPLQKDTVTISERT